jgi:hypothetical protein
MAKLGISTGSTPNDGTGDTLLSGAIKINQNFNEIYSAFGDGTNLNAQGLSSTTNINTTGVITASRFVGDGSGLIAVGLGSGFGVAVYEDNTIVGTATTINFGENLTVSPVVAGFVTVTALDNKGKFVDNITGIHTLSNVGVGTTTASSTLTVQGDGKFSGIVSAVNFYGSGSGLTGIPTGFTIRDNGTGIGTATVVDFGDYLTVSPISSGICTITSVFVGSNQLGVRTEVSQSTGSISSTSSANITFAGFKSYTLYKVQTSHAAWITLYTDTISRTADASRSQTTDPLPGSGVIAEVIASSAGITTITPATIGWNNDTPVSTNIYAKVKNNSGSTENITVTLTILQLET